MKTWICNLYVLIWLAASLFGCGNRPSAGVIVPAIDALLSPDSVTEAHSDSLLSDMKSSTAHYMDSLGLVDVADADSTIVVSLMYARADNFMGEVMYDDLKEAYLHPLAMKSLVEAQHLLKERHPGYSLIVYDAARPLSVQQKMWNAVKGTAKYIYVSNPARGGGLHNYGLAVDVSIVDQTEGKPLPMGTPVDYMGKEAHITDEAWLVEQGLITEQARSNRVLLREVMTKVGFCPLPAEWWHFNRCSRQTAREQYTLVP